MAIFAILEKNIVENIISIEQDLIKDFCPDKKTIEVKENEIVAIGMEYDESDGYFYWPQKFLSWTKKEGKWIPPKPYPEEEFHDEAWRDINKKLLISEERMQGLSFNSAGVPIEYTWEWDEENLDWKKRFTNFHDELRAGRFTSDTYSE
jgi:hypothetical protein